MLFLTLTICCTTDSSESFNLSSIASLQNLTSAVTLRLYGCTAVRLWRHVRRGHVSPGQSECWNGSCAGRHPDCANRRRGWCCTGAG